MITLHRCERCGARHPRESTAGLCPACLVRVVTGDDGTAMSDTGAAPSSTSMVAIGSRIGDYALEAPLGEGGMGVVFRARQLRLNRTVALKMLPFGRFSPEVHQRRFQVEAEAIAQLRHPNIVTIFEVGEHEGQPFLSMEFVDGPDLARVLQTRSLSIPEAARLVERVARAIHYAHTRGIAHRDLKPSNILLDADGEPRVTDFGLAKNAGQIGEVTLSGQQFGSPNYIPPEQASGKNDANSFASDVYGLGAILYHLVTRRPPFTGASIASILQQVIEREPVEPRLLNPELPPDLQTICLKCLEKDPARRYSSAGALADELGRFLRDEPIHARPIGPLARSWRWCRRRPALAAMTATTAMALCGGLAVSLTLWGKAQRRAHQVAESLLRVELERVEDLFGRGNSPESLARLARLLRTNPANETVAQRTISALTHRNFLLPATPEFENVHDGPVSPLAVSGRRIVTATEGGKRLVVWETEPALRRLAELPLSGPARVTALDPEGSRVAVVLRDRTLQFWSVTDRAAPVRSVRLPQAATTAHYGPEGKRLLVGLSPRGVAIVDGAEARILKLVPEAHHADLSADGRWFVTVTNAEAVLRHAETGEPAGPRIRHAYRIESVRFSADASRVVTTSADTSARIWEVTTGNSLGRPLLHSEHVLDAVFSPDGQRVLTRVLSERGQIWDVATGTALSPGFPLARPLVPAQFSPDGLSLLTQFSDRTELRDAFTGELLAEPLVVGQTSSVRFLEDGRRIVTARFAGPTQLWSLLPGDAAPLVLPHNLDLVGASFSRDGTRVLTVSKDRTARLWSATDGRPVTSSLAHERRLTVAVLNEAGDRIATGDSEGHVRSWNAMTGEPLAGAFQHPRPIVALAFSIDGKRLVAAGATGIAEVRDAATGRRLFEWHHGANLRALAVSPGGTHCATTGGLSAQVWDLATGDRVAEFKHGAVVLSVGFSPDGQLLATGDVAGIIRWWRVADRRESGMAHGHTAAVNSLRFSSDGRLLVSASSDHTARVWNVLTGRAVTRPLTHDRDVVSAAISPDGRLLLTGSVDATVRAWSIATSLPVTDALQHENRLEAAEWSPDGRLIATASWDACGRIWSLPQFRLSPASTAWLADVAETFGGLALRGDETPVRVARDQLAALRQGLERFSDLPEFQSWARWLLGDRSTRPLFPAANVTAAEHAAARFDDNKPNRVRHALRLAPMDPRGLARWSRLVLQQNDERNPRKLAEATSTAELATRIDPTCCEAWCSLAFARLAAGSVEQARSALIRAEETRPATPSPEEQRALRDLRRRIERAAAAPR